MTSLDELPIRDDLRGRKPYGAPVHPVPVILNVNENAYPVPAEVSRDISARIAEALRGVNRYPDREFTELRSDLAKYLGNGLSPDQLWAANGSNEVLQHIFQAFGGPGRTALGFGPTYSMYPLIAAGTGTSWISAPSRGVDYELDSEQVLDAIRANDPDIVLLCSPNNPTGTPISIDLIEAVTDCARGIVVVDEAYFEFSRPGTKSALTLLGGRPKLLVSRTMSKAFAFAGARVGYLAADAAVNDALRLVRLPYHLSSLTQAAACGALAHTATMLANVNALREQRDLITDRLNELGFVAHRSDANFVFFGGVDDPPAVFRALLEQGIIIRDVGIPNHLRVTAGRPEETSAFLTAIAPFGPARLKL